MKRWQKILACLLAVLLLLLLAGFLLPRHARVKRTLTMRASPGAVFERISTLRHWPEWTAWTTHRFPDLTYRFEGPAQGVGATLIATGKSSGDGTVRLLSADPERGVTYELDFNHGTQRFQGRLSWEATGPLLRVVWELDADLGQNPMKRWGGLFLGNLMGGDMGDGLARLRSQLESPP